MEKQDAKKKETTKDKKQTPNFNEEQKITIMPTMIDDSEEKNEKRRDLSAIIPKFEDYSENENAIELISKDNGLKSDGSVLLALINENGEATVTSEAKIPAPIDIEERKKEKQRSKNSKKTKKKAKNKSKEAQKMQNITALCSLIVMIALAGFGYWFFNKPTEFDYQPLVVEVELGSSLPTQRSSYVKPGIGKEVDPLMYSLDVSKVVLEEAGEYPFTITYKNTKKDGKIIIKDTTPPELEVRNVTITEGGSYNASTFVESCRDPSGCNYSFQDSETEKKYTTRGSYVVYVVATDAYKNPTTKKASLIIEAEGNVRKYTKHINYNHQLGYEIDEEYELHYAEYPTYSLLINGTFTRRMKYQDQEVYEKSRKTYNGEPGYSCDDSTMEIIQRKSVNVIGNNYSRLDDIESYLNNEGYERG